jgi:hypothetical protein
MAKKKDQGYWENVIKEFGEFRRARNYANEEEGDYKYRNWVKPSSSEQENLLRQDSIRANKQEKSAIGQLAGAVLQGRRYTKSGKQKNK